MKLGNTDGFVQTIKTLWDDPEKCQVMGQNARADYETKYLPEDNYKQLMAVYNSLI